MSYIDTVFVSFCNSYTEIMKKLILILLFSTVMFSSPSYAEWTKGYNI